MIEIENLKDEPYDKTMEVKVCGNYYNYFVFIIEINNYYDHRHCLKK